MALDVPFVFEIRQTGADTNGGGFAFGASIAAPSAPSVSNIISGGSVAANTYYCVITYTDSWGDTVISGQTSTTTTGSSSTITVTSPSAQTGAKTWNCYFGTTSGGPYFPQGTVLTIGSNRVITTTPPTTGTQPSGVDYSQQDSPQINVSDGVANGTTTFTSATAGFSGAHVGNLIRVGSATWLHIVAVTNSTTVVLNGSVSTNTGLPVVVGGALATPGMAGGICLQTANSVFFLKYSATPYTYSASTNVSGGGINISTPLAFVGYDSTRTVYNSDANRPTLQPSANSATFFVFTGAQTCLTNIIFSNPGAHTSCGISNNNQGLNIYHNLKISGHASLCATSTESDIRFCDMSFPTVTSLGASSKVIGCDWHDGGGLQLAASGLVEDTNVYNITVGTYAIQCNGAGVILKNVNLYHFVPSGGPVYAIQINTSCIAVNVVIEDVNPGTSGGYAFTAAGTPVFTPVGINCFVYNIKTAVADPVTVPPNQLYGITTLTASAFTNPGSGNFAPNNTAGGGSVIQGEALPTTFPAGTTTNALDAGAVQHSASTGSINRARVFTGM